MWMLENFLPWSEQRRSYRYRPGSGWQLLHYWLPTGETTSSVKNMSAGSYSVTVTSAAGVTTEQLVVITETYVKVATSVKDQRCNGDSNASLDVTASGASNLTGIP